MSWVFRKSDAKLGDRLVLLILADKAEDDGDNARPSVPTIAKQACLSERQVQRCLRNLEAAGAIKKTGRYRYPGQRNGVNVYQVIMPKGDILSSNGDSHDNQRVTPMSPNPSLEPVQEQVLAAAPRKRNDVWDALTYVFGEPTVPTAIRLRGQVCRDLTNAGATRDQVVARASAWPAHFDQATLTDTALRKHWDTLGRKPLRRAR